MKINVVADARKHRWDNKRLAIDGESDVAGKGFIENFVDCIAIVNGANRFTHNSSAIAGGKCVWQREPRSEARSGVDSRRRGGMSELL